MNLINAYEIILKIHLNTYPVVSANKISCDDYEIVIKNSKNPNLTVDGLNIVIQIYKTDFYPYNYRMVFIPGVYGKPICDVFGAIANPLGRKFSSWLGVPVPEDRSGFNYPCVEFNPDSHKSSSEFMSKTIDSFVSDFNDVLFSSMK